MAAALAAAWLAAIGRDPDLNPLRWLEDQGIGTALAKALWPVLLKLWAAAYELGESSAITLVGGQGAVVTVDALIQIEGRAWLNQIVSTRLERLAAVLARGGSAAELAAAIKAVLASGAELIAQTEITRAISAAAVGVYRSRGLSEFRWVCEGPDPCPECLANQAAGPHFYGNPYPSGAIEPPQHPRCRCALIPVEIH